MTASTYWNASRSPRYSLLFVLPLFVLYEGLAAILGEAPGAAHVRNAADVALKTPFIMLSGARGTLAFFATVIGACVFFVARDMMRNKGQKLEWKTFALMFGEAAVLGLLLGVVVGTITQKLLAELAMSAVAQSGTPGVASLGQGTRLMLALGAGLYEELLFRVLLVGGIAAGLRWLVGSAVISGAVAAVIGAVVFSAFHYVGEYGEKLQLASFMYRAIAGLVFSGLYLTRGFGVTAWTHALYDVYVMVV